MKNVAADSNPVYFSLTLVQACCLSGARIGGNVLWTDTVREGPFSMGIQRDGQVPKFRTRANRGNLRAVVDDGLVEKLEIDHQVPIFSTDAVRAVVMTTRSSIDFDAILTATSDCRLDMRHCAGESNGTGRESETEVVRTGRRCKIRGPGKCLRDARGREALDDLVGSGL